MRQESKNKQGRTSSEHGSRTGFPHRHKDKTLTHLSTPPQQGPEEPFRPDQSPAGSCSVGDTSPSPEGVPGALGDDERINAKCHFRMIKTQEVTSVPIFTHTLEADGQKQAIRGEKAYFTAPQNKGIPAKDIFLHCIKGKVMRWQVGQAFKR